MTINMEVKKHKLEQLQNGSWKITFTVHSDDMSMEVIQAAMGAPYGLAMVPIDYDNPDPTDYPKTAFFPEDGDIPEIPESVNNPVARENRGAEKSEGEKVFALSHIRCKDGEFQEYLCSTGWGVPMDDITQESHAKDVIYRQCDIKSRSELITDVAAQGKFRELDQKFKGWWGDKQWEDNLDREDYLCQQMKR